MHVSVARTAGQCQLSVSDSGPGIPANEREAVLRRFHRLDQGGQQGSGLGLAIVARIAELHGAGLDLAASDGVQGLRVTITWSIAA